MKKLNRELLEVMTRPRVPDGTSGRDPVSSWGLGVRVVVKDDVLPAGSFGWSSTYGTIGLQVEKDVMACLE